MKKDDFRKETGIQVDEVNCRAGKKILAITGRDTQWARGNGSVIRKDTDHASTLSINWRKEFLAIGCDGKRTGINTWLAKRYPESIKNGQNIRYRCNYDDLPDILEHYANEGN